jgi:hypothetical protein
MGGAPTSDNSGLAGGPGASATTSANLPPASNSNPKYVMRLVTYRRADGVLVTAMRPIKNPEDMTAAERRQVYGNRYAPRARVTAHSHSASAPASHAAPVRVAAAPAAKPAVAAKPVAVAKPAPAPAPKVAAAKPMAPVVAPAPAPKTIEAPVAVAPVVAAKLNPPPAGLPEPADSRLAALQTAVGGEVAAGSKLTVPEALAKGEPAQVSLSLPQTVLAIIQREAAKLGLGKAAKKADVTATLSGEGYEITPNGPQTATLKPGEAPAFNWQVKPGAGEKGPLKADVDASLNGGKAPMTFSLASLEQAVKSAVDSVQPRAKGSLLDKLAIPGMPTVKLPGVGEVPSKSVVALGLLLAGLALLVAIARSVGENARRAERRRKFRTMGESVFASPEPDDSSHHAPLAAPLAAAAAGAAIAGAAAAHGHHDDHGHGHDAHGHDAHGHGAHGHDDHGHGDHGHGGHGHDDHGHGGHDDHGHGHAAAHHDDHGHAAHGHDDHGHGDHGHGDHGHGDHGHGDHGHGGHGHDDHGHGGHDDHGHGHAAAHHDDHGHAAHGHDDHGHGGHGHDDHGHGGHDDHGHGAAAAHHDDHGHGGHGHDDHGHGHDDHGHGGHGHGHDDHGHGAAAHHDDHGHGGHDDHGHGAHGHDDHGHGHDDHGHGHDDHHGHKQLEHAH